MPPLPIPRRYRAGLASVDRLTDEDVDLLVERLDGGSAEVSFEELAVPLRGELAADVDLERLLEAVASLNTLLPEDGSGAKGLAEDVSESNDISVPEERRPAYVGRLERLIRVPTLILAARASEVASEHDKVFHDVRILTDMRPVFGPDPASVEMAALVGTMKLEYHLGGKSAIDSVYIALDRGDLEQLQRVIARALKKMDSLAKLMKERDVPRWTANYHDHGPR